MRQDLVFKFKSTVDVYDAVPVFNDQTGDTEITYVFNRNDAAFVVQNPNGTYMTTRTAIPRFSAVRDLKDRKGQSLSAYQQLYVTDVFPELDASGAVMAWKHTLRADLPKDFKKELAKLIDLAIN